MISWKCVSRSVSLRALQHISQFTGTDKCTSLSVGVRLLLLIAVHPLLQEVKKIAEQQAIVTAASSITNPLGLLAPAFAKYDRNG